MRQKMKFAATLLLLSGAMLLPINKVSATENKKSQVKVEGNLPEENKVIKNITYHLEGGSNHTSNPDTYEVGQEVDLYSPVRPGYRFMGWYTERSYENKITKITSVYEEDLELYAKWKTESYRITYRLNGGTNHKSNPTGYTVESEDLALKEPTRKGYRFVGWYVNGKKQDTIKKGSVEPITFEAKWKAESYRITYRLDGGTNHKSNPTSYTVESGKIVLKAPTRTGYYFAGWQVNGKAKDTIEKGSMNPITFQAKWIKYSKAVYLKKDTNIYKTNSTKQKLESGVRYQLYYSAGVTKGNYLAVMNAKTKKEGFIHKNHVTSVKTTTKIVKKTKKHYDYATMEANLRQLAKVYPQWLEVTSIGKTEDNRQIFCATVGNKKAKKQMIVTVSMHAREYLNTMFTMQKIEEYMNNYQKKINQIGMSYEQLFNQVCLYIVPMVNPDGVQIAQYGANGLKSKRLQKNVKNMLKKTSYTKWKANANGVNLNRNFPTEWNKKPSSNTPNATSYSGKSAASEKETKAIIKLFDSLSNPVGSIAYHSMGNLADWNQNKKSKYYAINREMGNVTRKLTGYKTPSVDLSGGVGGTMGTWLSQGKREMPNITIETGNITCPLPYSYYNRLWKDNRYVIESLTKLFYK